MILGLGAHRSRGARSAVTSSGNGQLPIKFGKYELLELVGRGGMAEIYRARTVGLGGFEHYCAIKKILPHLNENQEFITMLVDEAKIAVSLQHANIVAVHDLGKIDGSLYIAMEYVHGMDLATILKTCAYNNFLIPFEHSVQIGMQVCAGMGAAHTKTDEHGVNLGIIHRDISPHNILISYDGEVKIIDFGVAKASIKMTHTMSGIIKGKLLYMAPEQAMAKEIDQRADLFSLGLVLYKMVTHQLPFEGENEFQIYNKLVQGKVTPPRKLNPRVPPSLDELIVKSLRRKPEQRFQDAFEFRSALNTVLAELAPGYSPSRLAAFMETYFPPRPLVNPEPASVPDYLPLGTSGTDVGQGQPGAESLLTLAPPELMGQVPGYAVGQLPPPLPPSYADLPATPPRPSAYGMPAAPGQRWPGSLPALPASIGQDEKTMQVNAPFGVSLIGDETMPASPGLFATEAFPDAAGRAVPLDYGDLGGEAPRGSGRLGLLLKILGGVLLFLLLLVGGIFGGYYLLEQLSPVSGTISVEPGGLGQTARTPLFPATSSPAPSSAGSRAGTALARPRETDGAASPVADAPAPAPSPAAADAPAPAPTLTRSPSPGADESSEASGTPGSPGFDPANSITLTLESMPPGAQIVQGDRVVAFTDTSLVKKKKPGAKIRFTFRKDGYRPVTRTVSLDKDQRILVRLSRN